MFSLWRNESAVTIGHKIGRNPNNTNVCCPMGHYFLWSCRLCCHVNQIQLCSCVHTLQSAHFLDMTWKATWFRPQAIYITRQGMKNVHILVLKYIPVHLHKMWEAITQWLRGTKENHVQRLKVIILHLQNVCTNIFLSFNEIRQIKSVTWAQSWLRISKY